MVRIKSKQITEGAAITDPEEEEQFMDQYSPEKYKKGKVPDTVF